MESPPVITVLANVALAYVDDICIPTAGTFKEHMRDVGMVFDRLIEAGFTVRCDKCHIGMKEVPYLGEYSPMQVWGGHSRAPISQYLIRMHTFLLCACLVA